MNNQTRQARRQFLAQASGEPFTLAWDAEEVRIESAAHGRVLELFIECTVEGRAFPEEAPILYEANGSGYPGSPASFTIGQVTVDKVNGLPFVAWPTADREAINEWLAANGPTEDWVREHADRIVLV